MMKTLSPIGEAIRHYKLNANGGYEEWSKVARAPDYRMHVPSMGFDVTGHDEVRDCLLYTSPSPRDVEESRMPSSA